MANEPDARLYAKTVAKAGESSQKHVEQLMRAYFAKNPGTDVASARDFAIYAIDAASTQYGAAASAAAVELRDAMAASAGANVAPALPYVYEPDLSHIEDNVHYHSGRLAEGDRDAFVRQMGETARYHTMRGANEAMDAVTAKDAHGGIRVRFALMPMGASPCVYCLQRLGLGFFYKSALTADHARPHKHCNCLVVPGYGESPKLKGYNSGGVRKRFEACERTLGESLAGLSDQERTNAIAEEASMRDYEWLRTGAEPPITFSSDKLKAEKERDKPLEIQTAHRLRKQGFPCDFAVDEIVQKDANGRPTGITIGLADLENGMEIKTLQGASSPNTINSHLKNTSKKQNATSVVFDNHDNEGLPDDELAGILRSSKAFHRGRVYMIENTGEVRFIR